MQGLVGSIFKGTLATAAFTKAVDLAGEGLRKAFDIGRFALDSASDFEQSRIAFDTMLGSAEKAKKLLKEVSDFAAKTPFELPEVVEGAKKLLAYNVEAENLLPTFRMLGDIASGVGREKLPQLILAFGQVKAATRLTGMELRQFTEAGVPLISLLAKHLGKAESEIQKLVSDGAVKFKDVEAALRMTTSEGGKFFNLMERQSKTFSGTMSNVRDNLGRVAREIIGISDTGDIREGSIFALLTKAATRFLEWTNANQARIQAFFIEIIEKLLNVGQIARDVFRFLQENRDTIATVFAVIGTAAKLGFNILGDAVKLAGKILTGIKFVIESVGAAIGWVIDRFNDLKRTVEGGIKIPKIEWPKIDFKLPGFAAGGTMTRSGLAVVGERGPELVALPGGSRVFSNSQSRQMAGQGGGISIGEVHVHNEIDLLDVMKFAGMQLKYSGL